MSSQNWPLKLFEHFARDHSSIKSDGDSLLKAYKKEINLEASFKKLRFEVKNVVYNLGSDKKVTTNKKRPATRPTNRLSALKGLLPRSPPFVPSKFKLGIRTRSVRMRILFLNILPRIFN